jgi:hypothetical protein
MALDMHDLHLYIHIAVNLIVLDKQAAEKLDGDE